MAKELSIERIQVALAEADLDGWLFFDHHHRDPLAYRVLQLQLEQIPTRRWYYFIPRLGEPTQLVHRLESHILKDLPGKRMQYAGWQSQFESIELLLKGARRIAMQYSPECAVPYVSMVDAGTIELVRKSRVEVVTSADLIQMFEATWDEAQLASHLEAGRRVDRIRASAFDLIRERLRSHVQTTEYEIHQFIRNEFLRDGLVTDHGPIVAVSDNASDPHYEPKIETSRAIEQGDVVLIDMWAKLADGDSVYYDITWTGYCGASLPERVQTVFEVVAGARDAGVETVKAAAASASRLRGFEVDDAVRGHIRYRGFDEFFFHRTGHSIGREVHGTGANMDNLETHDDRRIIPRTCFSIEPGVYLPEFGIRSEVNVYVGEGDAIVTGEVQRELLRL